MRDRSRQQSRFLSLALLLVVCLQLWWRSQLPLVAKAEPLPAAPPGEVLQAMSFGEPAFGSRLLSLWLQSFDSQAGVSLNLQQLDYRQVCRWLAASLQLDPQSQYPLLVASHWYGLSHDPEQLRVLLDFIAEQVALAPEQRWRWLADAVIIAKHRLGNLDIALTLTRQLSHYADRFPRIPSWAGQMQIFVLEDLGEYQAAANLLGALLAAEQISSPQEAAFLLQRLQQLDKKVGP